MARATDTDGTIWGGEFLLAAGDRLNVLRGFGNSACQVEKRPSGNRAEPLWAFLFEIWGEDALDRADLPPIRDFPEINSG